MLTFVSLIGSFLGQPVISELTIQISIVGSFLSLKSFLWDFSFFPFDNFWLSILVSFNESFLEGSVCLLVLALWLFAIEFSGRSLVETPSLLFGFSVASVLVVLMFHC